MLSIPAYVSSAKVTSIISSVYHAAQLNASSRRKIFKDKQALRIIGPSRMKYSGCAVFLCPKNTPSNAGAPVLEGVLFTMRRIKCPAKERK
jgi:hypothetical protein